MTDADIEKYLKMFTLLPLSEIAEIVETHEVGMHFDFLFCSKFNSAGISLNEING